jgi:TolA-binding protein
MADNKEEPIVDVQGALSKTEQYIEQNKKSLLVILSVVAGLIILIFGYREFYSKPMEQQAYEAMFAAEKYFEKDSVDKAMNGDGTNPGFIEIVEEYGSTKAGNLAKYYLGVCYFQKGNYEACIESLDDFSPKGLFVGPVSESLFGDALMELGKTEEAIDHYLKGANMDRNEMTTPMLLMKAGKSYELLGKYKEAAGLYEQIRNEFPETNEGKEIDKHLFFARTKAGITE